MAACYDTLLAALNPNLWWKLNEPDGTLAAADSGVQFGGSGLIPGTYDLNLSIPSPWVVVGACSGSVAESNPHSSVAVAGSVGDYCYLNTGVTPTHLQIDMYTTVLGDFFFGCNSSGAGLLARLDGRGGQNSGLLTTSSWTSWAAPQSWTTGYTTGTWYHFDITFSGGVATCKINGTTVGSLTFASPGTYIGFIGDGGGGTTYFANLIVNGTPITITTPQQGLSGPIPGDTALQCANKSGVGSQNQLPSNLGMVTNWTQIIWLKFTSTAHMNPMALFYPFATAGFYSIIEVGANSPGVVTLADGQGHYAQGGPAINDGNWHMVAITMGSPATMANVSIYIDGVPVVVTSSGAWSPTRTNYPYLYVGQNGFVGNPLNYTGEVAQVACVNGLYTAAQIAALYAQNCGGNPIVMII